MIPHIEGPRILPEGSWVSHWFWNSKWARRKMCCKWNLKCLKAHVYCICIKKRREENAPSFLEQCLLISFIPFRLHATFYTLRSHWLFINLILPEKCSGEGVEKRQKSTVKFPKGPVIPGNGPDSEDCHPNILNFFKALLNSR